MKYGIGNARGPVVDLEVAERIDAAFTRCPRVMPLSRMARYVPPWPLGFMAMPVLGFQHELAFESSTHGTMLCVKKVDLCPGSKPKWSVFGEEGLGGGPVRIADHDVPGQNAIVSSLQIVDFVRVRREQRIVGQWADRIRTFGAVKPQPRPLTARNEQKTHAPRSHCILARSQSRFASERSGSTCGIVGTGRISRNDSGSGCVKTQSRTNLSMSGKSMGRLGHRAALVRPRSTPPRIAARDPDCARRASPSIHRNPLPTIHPRSSPGMSVSTPGTTTSQPCRTADVRRPPSAHKITLVASQLVLSIFCNYAHDDRQLVLERSAIFGVDVHIYNRLLRAQGDLGIRGHIDLNGVSF